MKRLFFVLSALLCALAIFVTAAWPATSFGASGQLGDVVSRALLVTNTSTTTGTPPTATPTCSAEGVPGPWVVKAPFPYAARGACSDTAGEPLLKGLLRQQQA